MGGGRGGEEGLDHFYVSLSVDLYRGKKRERGKGRGEGAKRDCTPPWNSLKSTVDRKKNRKSSQRRGGKERRGGKRERRTDPEALRKSMPHSLALFGRAGSRALRRKGEREKRERRKPSKINNKDFYRAT